MGSIKARKNRLGKTAYHCEIRRRGYPRVSETFYRLTDAKHWIQETEANLRVGRFVDQFEASKHTLEEAIDRYVEEELVKKPRSYDQQQRQLEWFKRIAGYRLLSEITPAFMSELKSKLLREKNSQGRTRQPPTWNRYQSAISCVFQICCGEWQWMEDNPARRVRRERENPGRVRFLSEDERERLLNACKEIDAGNLYVAVVLTLSTGMRKSEVLGLKWEDIDFERQALILHDTKNKERRRLPVRGMALELLKQHHRSRIVGISFVFPGLHSRRTGHGFSIRESWDEALDLAKIDDFRFHDLRHSCASYLAMNGASLLEIAEILGHKTLQMVKRYSHLAESHTAGVVERMNRRIFGGEASSGKK